MPEDRILDIGCGDGFLTSMLSVVSQRVVGVDLSVSGLTFAKEKIKNFSVDLVQASAEHLPFQDNSFDVVTLFEVIEHIPEDLAIDVVEEILRVLRKHGKVIVTTPDPYNLQNRLFGRSKTGIKHAKEYTFNELLSLFNKFKLLEISGVYLPIPPLSLLHKERYSFIYEF
jgi:ubiquinone/menaquinone biosynthesis C-methylase UbiE